MKRKNWYRNLGNHIFNIALKPQCLYLNLLILKKIITMKNQTPDINLLIKELEFRLKKGNAHDRLLMQLKIYHLKTWEKRLNICHTASGK